MFVCVWLCDMLNHVCLISLVTPHYYMFLCYVLGFRWGSLQKMVSRLFEQQKAIKVVLSSDCTVSHLMPTWQDLDV